MTIEVKIVVTSGGGGEGCGLDVTHREVVFLSMFCFLAWMVVTLLFIL